MNVSEELLDLQSWTKQEEQIYLFLYVQPQCHAKCRSRHQQLPLVNIYRQLDKGSFQEIRTFAKKMLSLFGSTYLCEKPEMT